MPFIGSGRSQERLGGSFSQPGPKIGIGMNNYNNPAQIASENSHLGLGFSQNNQYNQVRYKQEDEVTDSEEEIGDESGSFAGHSIKVANETKPSAGGFQRQKPEQEKVLPLNALLKPGPPPVPGLKPG